MVQLETVGDFERIRKVIENLASLPWEYIVQDFGFCSYCNSITPNRHNDLEAQCLTCDRVFKKDSGGFTLGYVTIPHYHYYVASIEDIPTEELRRKCKSNYSREYQKKLFFEKLEFKIKKLKRKAREINNEIHGLAKLR